MTDLYRPYITRPHVSRCALTRRWIVADQRHVCGVHDTLRQEAFCTWPAALAEANMLARIRYEAALQWPQWYSRPD